MNPDERRIMAKCVSCRPDCGACDDLCECPECGMDYRQVLEPGTVYVCTHCGTESVQRGRVNELTEYWGEFWTEDGGDTAPRVRLERKRSTYQVALDDQMQQGMSETGRMIFAAMTEMNQAFTKGARG
jgi:hypothetical protein